MTSLHENAGRVGADLYL